MGGEGGGVSISSASSLWDHCRLSVSIYRRPHLYCVTFSNFSLLLVTVPSACPLAKGRKQLVTVPGLGCIDTWLVSLSPVYVLSVKHLLKSPLCTSVRGPWCHPIPAKILTDVLPHFFPHCTSALYSAFCVCVCVCVLLLLFVCFVLFFS